jgi:hypothetical protein
MPRTQITTVVLIVSLAALAGCGRSESSSGNVTMRDMEVIDGTANDSMVDLDNATLDGTALENAAAAAAAAPVNAAGNAAAPAPNTAPAVQTNRKADADAAE